MEITICCGKIRTPCKSPGDPRNLGSYQSLSFVKLLRIVAYIMRFKRKSSDATTMVKFEELEQCRKIVLRLIQHNNFSAEIKELKKCREVGRGSNLSALTHFLDQNDLIRVGGRLKASELSFDAKHPVLLPNNDPIVKIIHEKIHKENMHCGAQTLLATSRQRYWAIKAKAIARNVFLKCIKCTRAKPKLMEQIMGQLPPLRVTQARLFLNSGVDFCGFRMSFGIIKRTPST